MINHDEEAASLMEEGYLSAEESVAETDPKSGVPVVFGYAVTEYIPPTRFENLRRFMEFISNGFDWWLVTRRIDPVEFSEKEGGISRVGLGPSGGFKWVEFCSGTTCSHPVFRPMSQSWAALRPRNVVKCDRNGNSTRVPAAVIGRKGRGGPPAGRRRH